MQKPASWVPVEQAVGSLFFIASGRLLCSEKHVDSIDALFLYFFVYLFLMDPM